MIDSAIFFQVLSSVADPWELGSFSSSSAGDSIFDGLTDWEQGWDHHGDHDGDHTDGDGHDGGFPGGGLIDQAKIKSILSINHSVS